MDEMYAPAAAGLEPVEILDQQTCWRLLAGAQVGRLAVVAAGELDIYPVNHLVDDRSLLFRTAEGTKLVEVVIAGRVAYEVDGYDEAAGVAWSVVAKGPCLLLERAVEIDRAEGLPLFPWHDSPKERFVRIEPEVVTGRRFHASGPHSA
jgi:nitroimidazol reductase NimA-like FMN-containing flavoprotein (pyridoxamine 5'-phosphate oxidase superfamily)